VQKAVKTASHAELEFEPEPEAGARLKRVRLELAREPGHPEGSEEHGYAFVAPLTPDGRLDPALWARERAHCRAMRFWAGEPVRFGLLRRSAGGPGGAHWLFDFDPSRSDDDEVGYRFDIRRFVEGEYLTLRDADTSHVFRVVEVSSFHRAASAASLIE